MLFTDLINEMPRSSDHKDLFQIYDACKNKASVRYFEDGGEDPRYVRNAYEMYDIYSQKMLASPLSVEKFKLKQNIIKSIGEHPKYLDENGVPILMINNSPLFYAFEDYVCFNDKRRNYPVMYLDKNFLKLDSMGRFEWLMSPQDMRNYFKTKFESGKTISSLSFLKAVGPEFEGNEDVNMFEFRSSVCILLPMTRDFLDFHDHPMFYIREGIMSKFYAMLVMFIDYMYSVYSPATNGQYMGTTFYPREDRPNIVLAGYGSIGIKNVCYTAYSFFSDRCHYMNSNAEYFQAGSISLGIRTDLRLLQMLEEALEEVMTVKDEIPLYGVVKVAENYAVVEECQICLSKSDKVLDPIRVKFHSIPSTGDVECKYGIVSSIGRSQQEALNNITTYMMDCPYISDVLVNDRCLSVDRKGREIKTARYFIKKELITNTYKKRRRIVDFNGFRRKFKNDGIGTYVDPLSYKNVRVHDADGKLLLRTDPRFDHLEDKLELFDDTNCIPLDQGKSSDSDEEFCDSLVDAFLGDEEVNMKSSPFENLAPDLDIPDDLKGLTIHHDYVYWYAISVKRFFYSIGIQCGLSHNSLNYLVRGGFLLYKDLDASVLINLRSYSLFKFHSNKVSIDISYSSQVYMIMDLFRKGIIKLLPSDQGGFIWTLVQESEDPLDLQVVYSI